MSHNAERDWSGRSYRKGGSRVRDLREAAEVKSWREGGKFPTFTDTRCALPKNKLGRDRFERVEREIAYLASNAAPLPAWTNMEYFSTIRVWDRNLLCRTGYHARPSHDGMQTLVGPFGLMPAYGYCW